MSLSANIILWTFSLTLAITGITFGIVASLNASRANQKITNLIANYWITNESQKILFENLKEANFYSKKLHKELEKEITYSQYALLSAHTRFYPIPKRVQETLEATKYYSLIKKYLQTKKELDTLYKKIIGDLKILNSQSLIPALKRKELMIYHEKLAKSTSNIVKCYAKIALK